ncbi:autotransported protein Lav [Haemophilus influenzae]|uniref:Autotransported protein Lav n=1 Tax=Haemophilus influenzae TaxID=727 RepID=A0A2X1RI52_HAEIF|nr:autotransported protein Lav [Haemophilus influenzae]
MEIDGERRVINNKTAIESQFGIAVKIKSHLTLQATFNRQTGKRHHAKQGAFEFTGGRFKLSCNKIKSAGNSLPIFYFKNAVIFV